MRIAIVSPHPISAADSGDRIRSAQLIAALRELGADPQLVAFCWQGETAPDGATHYVPGRPAGRGLRWLTWRSRLATAERSDPFAVHRAPGMQDRMRAAIEAINPDVVDFQHSFSWFATGRPSVATIHNVDSQRFATFDGVSPAQYATVIRTEREAVAGADATVVFSPLDADRLLEHTQPRALHVVPIGTDPGAPLDPPRPLLGTIAYVGSYDYAPNVSAVGLLRGQWATIKAQTPVRRLVVVGRRASEHFTSEGEFEVRSDVDSVRDALTDVDAVVVPLTAGGGVRVKIIEAFRLGLPVVSTQLGIEGLGAQNGVHAAIVERVEQLPAALAGIAAQETRIAMTAAAQGLWEREFSPRHMAERMLEVYELVRKRS